MGIRHKKAVTPGGEGTAYLKGSQREEVPQTRSGCNMLSGGGESLLRNHLGISGRRKVQYDSL